MAEVRPAPGLVPWVGGKRHLASRLVARIGAIRHRLHAEPFVGAGGVFLRRPKRAPAEAINDRSGEVVNLFRVVRHHPDALLAELRLQLSSREDFQRLLRIDPTTLTDERAAQFIALQRLVYGGKPGSSSFPARAVQPRSFDAADLRARIEAAHDRLARVTIECLPYPEFIERYDRSDTLFYRDPPYYGCEDYYGANLFERKDFERLSYLLLEIDDHFLLSIKGHPETRRLFAGFRIEGEPVLYRVSGIKRVTELVVSIRC